MKPRGLNFDQLLRYWMTVANTDNQVFLSVTRLGERSGVNPIIMDRHAKLYKHTLVIRWQDGHKYCCRAKGLVPRYINRSFCFSGDSPTHAVFDNTAEASNYQWNVALGKEELVVY